MKFNRKHFFYILAILSFTFSGFSQKDVKLLRQGNKLYEEGKYKEAEMDYRKALEINKESDTLEMQFISRRILMKPQKYSKISPADN
jgi:tetratricopeptide (TPR) repeat protein